MAVLRGIIHPQYVDRFILTFAQNDRRVLLFTRLCILNALYAKIVDHCVTQELADHFSKHFTSKIETIRQALDTNAQQATHHHVLLGDCTILPLMMKSEN